MLGMELMLNMELMLRTWILQDDMPRMAIKSFDSNLDHKSPLALFSLCIAPFPVWLLKSSEKELQLYRNT